MKIQDPQISIDHIFTEAIKSLKNEGRALEAKQLNHLYENHQIFNAGKVVKKGDLFEELKSTKKTINDANVVIGELDLVASHAGG